MSLLPVTLCSGIEPKLSTVVLLLHELVDDRVEALETAGALVAGAWSRLAVAVSDPLLSLLAAKAAGSTGVSLTDPSSPKTRDLSTYLTSTSVNVTRLLERRAPCVRA